MRLELDNNEATALFSALENYINGHGMPEKDEDEDVIEEILNRLQ